MNFGATIINGVEWLEHPGEFVREPLRDEAGKLRRQRLREDRLDPSRDGYLGLR